MIDTTTITKYAAGICGALLIFLLLNWGAETMFFSEPGHGEHAEAAYVIEVEEEETEEPTEMAEEDNAFAAALAAADAEAGAKVFSKCKACHKLEEGKKGVGPSLFGVVDRDIASVDGYKYSEALAGTDGDWSTANLNAFITNPKDFASGTKMKFKGLKKESDRANLIAYLSTIGN